jgi:hypothetical protein
VTVLDADRWPLVLARDQFAAVTGHAEFPPELAPRVVGGNLYYAGNNSATVVLRGVHVKLTTLWDFESPGGDAHEAIARGTRATVAIRQPPGAVPELVVTAANPADHAAVVSALRRRCGLRQHVFPGVSVEDESTAARLRIPNGLRTTHEAHFAAVLEEFARYFQTPRAVPPWERVNALTRYFITTQAVELARQKRQF